MKTHRLLLLLTLVIFAACKEDDPAPACSLSADAATRFFEFEHTASGKTFIAWTNKADVLTLADAQLALSLNERGMIINGPIARLPETCGEVNRGWSWYHKPNEWGLADFTIELCDGSPQYVEENIDEYIRIGGYCPWGARLLREIGTPF